MLINDKDGVDIVIGPVKGRWDGVQANVDFNFAHEELRKLDERCKAWDLNIMLKGQRIARTKFAAYQFLADGVERRTISMKFLEIEKQSRGKKKSYDVAAHVVQTVTAECDRDWGTVSGMPVMFVETRHLEELPQKERSRFIQIISKIASWALGIKDEPPKLPDSDLVVSVIGDDISLQLIKGHLVRSNAGA